MLQNIPEGWNAVDACMNMPVDIKDATIRRPDRCKFVDGFSPHSWILDGGLGSDGLQTMVPRFPRRGEPKIPLHPHVVAMLTRCRGARVAGPVPAESRHKSWA